MNRRIDTTDELDGLRRTIAAIEGRFDTIDPVGGASHGAEVASVRSGRGDVPLRPKLGEAAGGRVLAKAGRALSFGTAMLDRHFGASGGLPLGTLHECIGGTTRDAGALVGFAAALVVRCLEGRDGRVLWIADGTARREGGGVHAPGLADVGLDPGRVVEVMVDRPEEALWAFEEGLSCRGTAAIVAEIAGDPDVLDLTATRRLALRASRGGQGSEGSGRTLALLVRPGGSPQVTAAATRWRIASAPSRRPTGFAGGLGRPAFSLDLTKNRDGRLGRFVLEWDCDERRFLLLPTHSGTRAAPSRDRPPAPTHGGQVVAFERGGLARQARERAAD